MMGKGWHGLRRKVARRVRFWAQVRFARPVVVFESDDWGLYRQPSAALLAPYGTPGERADEVTESPADLERLYALLERYRDDTGRSACFTANFIVANPDLPAIRHDQFRHYYDRPIETDDLRRPKWQEGLQRRVFYPQYHGRYHCRPESWLQDLQTGTPGARELCAAGCFGGLSLLQGQGWRYHSEYLDWQTGRVPDEGALSRCLEESLGIFERVFGMRSLSTIAPHYIYPDGMDRLWQQAGIRYLQGAGYRLVRDAAGHQQVQTHLMGGLSPAGLLYLNRTVKFEPRRTRPFQGLEPAWSSARECLEAGVPVVIDTHRINYTGPNAAQALPALDTLLCRLQSHRPRFLTTPELGQAIAQRGAYVDVWDHSNHQLALREPFTRTLVRRCLVRRPAGLAPARS
jgi:hypothetical protein